MNISNKHQMKHSFYIGSKIKELRHKHNLSQKQLSEILGVHFNTVKNYEKNNFPVPSKYIEKLILLYDVDIESMQSEDSFHTIDIDLLSLITSKISKIEPQTKISLKYGRLLGTVYNMVIHYRDDKDLLIHIENEILGLLKLIEVELVES